MTMLTRTILSIFVCALSFPVIIAENPCRFEDPDRGVIDLTSVGRTDGKAKYANRIPDEGSFWKYSYNPCHPFSEGSVCQNVAACQIARDDAYMFALGTQESVLWHPGSEGLPPSISYFYVDKRVIVHLQCSPSEPEKFQVIAEDPINTFRFRLTHRCACWNECSGETTTTTTTSIAPPVSNACRFEYPGKGVVDFSFIGRTDDKAAYTDEMTRTVSNFKYSYNPCRSFSEGTGCIGVAVCQISNDNQQTLTLGRQESASWNVGSGLDNPTSINYVYADAKVTILLQCSREGNNEFEAFGEGPINTYTFRFTHKCACWNGCSNPSLANTTS